MAKTHQARRKAPSAHLSGGEQGERITRIESRVDEILQLQNDLVEHLRDAQFANSGIDGDFKLEGIEELCLSCLEKNEVFGGLSRAEHVCIVNNAEAVTLEPGAQLFANGDPCTCLYVVHKGIVEVSRLNREGKSEVVAHKGPGDVIGELGAFVRARNASTAIMPEGGEILKISSESFENLLEIVPKLGARFARRLADRLVGKIKTEDAQAQSRELEGSLAYFDLATIIQSLLVSEDCCGVLSVFEEGEEPVALVGIGDGAITAAWCQFIYGSEGFYQIFLMDMKKYRFNFQECGGADDSILLGCHEDLSLIPGVSLLMEACRRQDEYKRLRDSLVTAPNELLKTKTNKFVWEGENRDMAKEFWVRIYDGVTPDELCRGVLCSDFQVYTVLHEMADQGLIG